MTVSVATVSTDCVLGLNAGSGYSATVTDPRWTTQQVVDAVLASDGMVAAALLQNKDNPWGSGFYTTISGVVHGAIITASQGPIVSVQFVLTGGVAPSVRPASIQDLAEIVEEIQNALNLDFDAHFNLDGRVLYHNAAAIAAKESATISVNVITQSYTGTSACQCPDALRWLVFVGAMALLVPVEGENVGAASYWGGLLFSGLKAIIAGEGLPPGIDETLMAGM